MKKNSEIITQKSILRQKMKRERNNLSIGEITEKSTIICDHLLELPQIQEAKSIFCYVSFGSEVETHQLINTLLGLKKMIFIPKTLNKQIQPVLINSFEDLSSNHLGILEPTHSSPIASQIDVCITPGLAFTRVGERLGFGGGKYDYFFTKHPNLLKIALAFELQLLNTLPTTDYDKKVDIIVTEKQIF